MRTLNLGILAHVDAGKTSLTERLLYAAGVIDAVGRVDHGDTQTDTLALERERGITIKSAVVSFVVDDATVNLVDTPGHPDFIAEVDRALTLLDGAILVVSAVEGVQAQTRVLMRALRRLDIPTLIFVNKIDRMGAGDERIVRSIADKLSRSVVEMGTVEGLGTREAMVHPLDPADSVFVERMMAIVAEHDEQALESYVNGHADMPADEIRCRLATCTKQALVHPVFFGSAITGAGVDLLLTGVTELLPVRERHSSGAPSGVVFKIDRGPNGERSPIVRVHGGSIRVRDHVLVCGELKRVTGISVFEHGSVAPRDVVVGGQIAKLTGILPVRIGDTIGDAPAHVERHFAPPPFEAVVSPVHQRDRGALRTALEILSNEDPLIDLRQDDARGELSISLYGDVQREVVRDTLLRDFGVDAVFSETTTICIERLSGSGEAEEIMLTGRSPTRPFLAAVGLRVEPAPAGGGLVFSTGVELGRLPTAFINAVEETVQATLRQGLCGWAVPDCAVTMTRSGYWPRQSHAHGTFDKSMSSTAGDFRQLTPLVLMQALRRAGTIVHEQFHRFHLEAPAPTLGTLTRLLVSLHATVDVPEQSGESFVLRGVVPAARVRALRQQLPGLTGGDGFVETEFDSYQPVRGKPPTRARTGHDPRDRSRYLRSIAGRA